LVKSDCAVPDRKSRGHWGVNAPLEKNPSEAKEESPHRTAPEVLSHPSIERGNSAIPEAPQEWAA